MSGTHTTWDVHHHWVNEPGYIDRLLREMDRLGIERTVLIAMGGSNAFASFYDPGRRLPVYIAFPSVAVEVFLDEFYGDTPVSRFREK